MVHIGELRLGFFYTKDSRTLSEIGGGEEVSLSFEYAKTASGNVVAMLSKDGEVLDMDDIPCEEVCNACGGHFISFVRHGNTTAFLVSPSTLEYDSEFTYAEGNLCSLFVNGEDLSLKVERIAGGVRKEEVERFEQYLLVVTNLPLSENEEKREVDVSCAKAALFRL